MSGSSSKLVRLFAFLTCTVLLTALPGEVYALNNTLRVAIGSALTIPQIFNNIISYLGFAIAAVCIALFAVGGLFLVFGGVKEDMKQKGKDLIIGALIGLVVVGIAFALLRTIMYLLYVA